LGKFSEKSKSKPFLYLGFFCLLWWGLPSAFKIAIRSGFDEFHAPLWDLSTRIQDLAHYWGHISDSKKTLIEKGKQFQRMGRNHSLQMANIEILQKEEERLRRLHNEIDNLEDSLGLDSQTSFKPIVARVSRRTFSSWWQTIGLRKGNRAQIVPGLGVISHAGVVGRISKVGSRMSEVEVITNTSFRVVAHFAGDNRPVTFQGNGILPGGTPTGIVFDVPQDFAASAQKPLTLTTSSLGETFPKGLTIGQVFSLEGGEDGLFKTGQVILSHELGRLEEITILLPVE